MPRKQLRIQLSRSRAFQVQFILLDNLIFEERNECELEPFDFLYREINIDARQRTKFS